MLAKMWGGAGYLGLGGGGAYGGSKGARGKAVPRPRGLKECGAFSQCGWHIPCPAGGDTSQVTQVPVCRNKKSEPRQFLGTCRIQEAAASVTNHRLLTTRRRCQLAEGHICHRVRAHV